MQITKKQLTPTSVKLTIVADGALLEETKTAVLNRLRKEVKIQGFRSGKVPLAMVEKSVDQNLLQSEFIDAVLNAVYADALEQEKLRPVSQPKVSVSKFVPFTTVEADIEVEVVGDLKLPDYKKFRLARPAVKVEAKEVDDVIANLRTRAAAKEDVDRAAKDGDQITIDFAGTDAKTGDAIDGADGKDYPLIIGSKSFIPGFEPELIGLKAGDEKTFTITFPKDYGVATLQSKKVTFVVTVHKVQELVEPKLDDTFASTVGPFKTLAELKADIKKQLSAERENEARRAYESELLEKLAAKTVVAIPTSIVEEEIDRHEADERQNLTYRGQTWEEHLKEEGITEAEHREKQRPAAELRVKAGLLLSEIADAEKIDVSEDEIELQVQLLRGKYTDPGMQAELDKPAVRRDLVSRLLSEKTIAKLSEYATAK
jgi:trigger factor